MRRFLRWLREWFSNKPQKPGPEAQRIIEQLDEEESSDGRGH
jgi:hypothetical protein